MDCRNNMGVLFQFVVFFFFFFFFITIIIVIFNHLFIYLFIYLKLLGRQIRKQRKDTDPFSFTKSLPVFCVGVRRTNRTGVLSVYLCVGNVCLAWLGELQGSRYGVAVSVQWACFFVCLLCRQVPTPRNGRLVFTSVVHCDFTTSFSQFVFSSRLGLCWNWAYTQRTESSFLCDWQSHRNYFWTVNVALVGLETEYFLLYWEDLD